MLHNLKSKPSMVDAAVAYCILYKIQNTEGQQAGKQYVPAPCCKPSQAAPPIHVGWKPVYCHSSQPGESNLPRSVSCYLNPISKTPVDAAQSRRSYRPHTSGQPHIRPAWRFLSAVGGSGMLGLWVRLPLYLLESIPIITWACTALDAAAAVPVSRHT